NCFCISADGSSDACWAVAAPESASSNPITQPRNATVMGSSARTIGAPASCRIVFVGFDTEATPQLWDAGAIVSRSAEGLVEHQTRSPMLDWPTQEMLAKAHRLRGKVLRDGIAALVRSVRPAFASISEPDVHRQTVPIPLVEGAQAGRGAVGDQRRR